MSARTHPPHEEGIECTPDSLFRGLAGCLGFLLSLVVVTALGVTASGVFWTAQNMDRITDAGNYVILRTDVVGNQICTAMSDCSYGR